ncbi:carbohydrate ABC transporter permease [Demequina zhanjiangensis]|uniref:Carbohydrate ABC transporter permease n=1 Tax=Demequina zhanjiangensis TaxID=3051659 RepID=A0ABT8G4G0_9MICO|nr:carbohydrate ABC transporter permease [Demequina sp. SYSU T00b26]MDN4473814.1 carbohydrate ABC transporter permease [Demequina sp. SYSU T00b26]
MSASTDTKSRLNRTYSWVAGLIGIVVTAIIFIVPFIFIFFTASKTQVEAARLEFSPPTEWAFVENFVEVIQARDYILVTAFINSTIVTVGAVSLMVIVSAMVGYVLQRRYTRWNGFINFLVLAGLIVPPAVVPTIWVMQGLGLFKTMHGLILVMVAFGMAFCVLMFRAFVATIPRELDEAAIMDGAGPIRLFFQVVFPLLRSVIVTVIVVQSVFVFNDFQAPLYFFPGAENATVQVTLYNFQGQYATAWNLLFMDILLITIPMLVMYIFFNRQIVAGMTSGAVKG